MAAAPSITVHVDTRRLRLVIHLLILIAVIFRRRPAALEVRLDERTSRRGELRLVAVPTVLWRLS